MDDGSTDGTQAIVENYSRNIHYQKIKNIGPALARKRAVDLCCGDWIALCDSDDMWMPHHIANFIECRRHYPEISMYFANFDTIGAEEEPDKFSLAPTGWWESVLESGGKQVGYGLLLQDAYNAFLKFQPIFPSCQIFSRQVYEAVGGISEALGRIQSEDAHLTRRLIAYGRVGCGLFPSAMIRKHMNNYSSDFIKNLQGRLAVLEDIVEKRSVPSRFIAPTVAEIRRSRTELFHQLYWNRRYHEALILSRKIGFKEYSPKTLAKRLICFLRAMG